MISMDEKFMAMAIEEAYKAKKLNEVPIGAVIVHEGLIVGRGYNRRENEQTTLSHAELYAIEEANKKVGSWRLEDCVLYVTLEPCAMCAGAIIQSRIKRVVYGTKDPKGGCVGSLMDLLQEKQFNHQVEWTSGILEESCKQLLQQFFKDLRKNKRKDSK